MILALGKHEVDEPDVQEVVRQLVDEKRLAHVGLAHIGPGRVGLAHMILARRRRLCVEPTRIGSTLRYARASAM